MQAKITVHGAHSVISGTFPVDIVKYVTSYPSPGYQFAPAFKKGVWDGRVHLFKERFSTFPTGLLKVVQEALENEGVTVEVEDLRPQLQPLGMSAELEGIKFEYPYDYQLEACLAAVEKRQGIIKIATNGGKCLSPSTPVLLFNGTIKEAHRVRVGELLMGPDSLPRKVLSVNKNKGGIYRITPTGGGDVFECNRAHILTLINYDTKEIVDLSLNEYLDLPDYLKKRLLLFSVPVDYKFTRKVPREARLKQISSRKKNLYCFELGAARASKEIKTPDWVWTAPYQVRSAYLGGILSTVGEHKRTSFSTKTVDRILAEDITYLARSLGLRVRAERRPDYSFYVCIIGDLTKVIPTVKKKFQTPPTPINHTHYSFKVEYVGKGKYVGWTLDGDGRFLLGSFIVTHNTEVACAITKFVGRKTLFIVPTRELMHQSRERFKKRLGATDKEIGVVGDGIWEEGSLVTVAMVPTLEARLDEPETQQLLKSTEVLFLDECHRAGAESWYTVSSLCPATWRIGLSGTPVDRSDGADLRLLATTGNIIYEISNKDLVERGISPRASIIWDKVTVPVIPKKPKRLYQSLYKECITENQQLLQKTVEWAKLFHKLNLSTLILCEEISHGKAIDAALWDTGSFIPHQFIHGKESGEVRSNALESFSNGTLPVLIASRIVDEGIDLKKIDAMILAGSRKSKIKTLQRLGRGLRGSKLVVVEFANFCHSMLLSHSLKRLEDYKAEECFPIFHSGPDEKLVRKVMDL